jgi:hypothetical protein
MHHCNHGVGRFKLLKHDDFLFVNTTSTNDGTQSFLKQVGSLTN